jgi:GNAT superfamily N-acetyltransferase
MWVILNPASGPGSQVDGNYTKAIDRLCGAGCVVLGYVPTGYGKRPEGQVRRDIDRWLRLYPRVHGIFFDEMRYEDSEAAVAYQAALSRYAHDSGCWPTVGNPGAAFLTGNLIGWLAGLQAAAAFVAVRPAGGLCGFVEASVRQMADGCTTHPIGYVEGWYVDPDVRRQGVGRVLVEAAEAWAVSRGCREMASDAHLDNAASVAAHRALGFNDEAATVRFRKPCSRG